jgi:hypothetical protein
LGRQLRRGGFWAFRIASIGGSGCQLHPACVLGVLGVSGGVLRRVVEVLLLRLVRLVRRGLRFLEGVILVLKSDGGGMLV